MKNPTRKNTDPIRKATNDQRKRAASIRKARRSNDPTLQAIATFLQDTSK